MSAPGIKVFAPATVANVAVGYDVLGFALDKLGDEIIIRNGKQPGLVISEIQGSGGQISSEIKYNSAGFAAFKFLEYLGESERPLEIEIHKKVPLHSGLGSSAASAAAGVFAVNEFLKTGLTKHDILQFAVEGEQIVDGNGHMNNVAPSLLGGMVLVRDSQTMDYKKLHIPQGLFIAIIHPIGIIMPKFLKSEVAFNDVTCQQGNLGAFVAAMYTSDYAMIRRSLYDLLVEPQRAHVIPHFYEMKENALKLGALGFGICGDGPSMFALCDNSGIANDVIDYAKAIYKSQKISIGTYLSKINHEGAVRY